MIEKVICGNNLEVLKNMDDNSVDSIVTDPPYGLGAEPNANDVLKSWLEKGYHEIKGKGFMNQEWDAFVPQPIFWKECLRVLKPGGYLLSFAGTRTYDWIVMGLRLAGFEIRDQIAWIYGSGFPKSMDVSKAIDNYLGAEREVIGTKKGVGSNNTTSMKNGLGGSQEFKSEYDETIASTNQAKQYEGWGTALKPALEPIVMARKPLEGTVAKNVLKYGTGGINIDDSRVPTAENDIKNLFRAPTVYADIEPSVGFISNKIRGSMNEDYLKGRFPANVIHDGSEEVVKHFPSETIDFENISASRFFYVPKASKEERNRGLQNVVEKRNSDRKKVDGVGGDNPRNRSNAPKRNIHPTVKPVDLMRYLVKMVTPMGGIVLDPFLGSGTTAIACKLEKFQYIGIELNEEYVKIAEQRIKDFVVQYDIFDFMED